MKIIEIRPSKKFRYHWEANEGEGVQPTFAGKKDAVDYATGRFGGCAGEIHVYSQDGSTVEEKISVNDQNKYPTAG